MGWLPTVGGTQASPGKLIGGKVEWPNGVSFGCLYDPFDSLLGDWTNALGTASVVGGNAQCTAIAVDGSQGISNGYLESYVGVLDDGTSDTFTDWTNINVNDGLGDKVEATATVHTGSAAMKATRTTAAINMTQDVTVVPGITYTWTFWTRGDGVQDGRYRVRDMTNGVDILGNTLTGVTGVVYAQISYTFTAPTGCILVRLYFVGPGAAGVVYFDDAVLQRVLHIRTCSIKQTSMEIDAGIVMPAAGAVPRAIILRCSDALNYWRIMILPGTAGDDFFIQDCQAGVITTRASADVDWTVNDVDDVRVISAGAVITVYHRKSGAATWTQACTFADATFNYGIRECGYIGFAAGTDILSYWKACPRYGLIPYPDAIKLLVGGQSNASGRGLLAGAEASDSAVLCFRNDYTIDIAEEPTDDNTDQIDAVSLDATPLHSFLVRAGKQIIAGSATQVLWIPCAKGTTDIDMWRAGADHFDRTTLYGSANSRRALVANDGLDALIWYGHEGNAGGYLTYIAKWTAMMTDWRAEVPNIPMIYVQLAKNTVALDNHNQHMAAEQQRLMETGSGDAAEITRHWMVVAFDLSLIDTIHLDTTGQKTLGDRIGLAIREHVLGEAVNGTGPRVVSLIHPGGNKALIKIDTTQELAVINADADNQFLAYDAGVPAPIASVVRDVDTSAILITLVGAAAGAVTVSYGDVVAAGFGITLANVVKDTDGLPLPQFDLLAVV